MYLSHYNLKIEPFSISTDPKFLWLGEKHKEALAALKYGILANKGFLLLTGDVGTGKTTLINALMNKLGDQVRVATVSDPGMEKLDFLNFIAGAFKLKKSFKTKGEFLSYFSLFLRLAHNKNKKVLLIIDEAQRLNDDLLEEIRLLSNIEKRHTKLINIFFVGQNEFNEILMKKENRALRQRITLIHTLETLDRQETHEYIRYRLQVAGAAAKIFNPPAIEEVYSFSGGYPRLINIICDHALLTGFVKEKAVIDAQIIQECARELRIPIKSYEKENPQLPSQTTGPNLKEIAGAKRSWLTARTVFLLTLLLLAAAAFYFWSVTGPSAIFVKKGRNLFADVLVSAKNAYRPGAGLNSETSNTATSYRIAALPAVNPERDTPDPAMNPILDKSMPDEPESMPESENAEVVSAVNTPVPEKKTFAETGEAASFGKKFIIFFDYNSFDLSSDAVAELEKIVAILFQNPDKAVVIRGFTDNTGKFSYNLKLSESRAAAVKNYLVGNGIKPNAIDMLAMGPDHAVDERGNEKPNQMNRRVEIEID